MEIPDFSGVRKIRNERRGGCLPLLFENGLRSKETYSKSAEVGVLNDFLKEGIFSDFERDKMITVSGKKITSYFLSVF